MLGAKCTKKSFWARKYTIKCARGALKFSVGDKHVYSQSVAILAPSSVFRSINHFLLQAQNILSYFWRIRSLLLFFFSTNLLYKRVFTLIVVSQQFSAKSIAGRTIVTTLFDHGFGICQWLNQICKGQTLQCEKFYPKYFVKCK